MYYWNLFLAFFVLLPGLGLSYLPNSQKPNVRLGRTASFVVNSEDGYGPIGSLIRQGPVPFFIRLAKPDTYDAAVKKYMALEKCSRIEAQANMDAYFQDPNGWAAQKLRSRQTGVNVDYVNVNQSPKELALTGVWAVGIIYLIWRIIDVQLLQQH